MFIDDLEQVKQCFRRLHNEIGVFAVDYKGFDVEAAEYLGDYFTFQCEPDQFFKYCKNHSLVPEHKSISSRYEEYCIQINENIYFTLVRK